MGDHLTAMDIERQEFPQRWRGYDPEEVRLYLRAVAAEVERLHRESAALREEVGQLRQRVASQREREQALQDTLVAAQQMAQELRERSRAEADFLLQQARARAERMLEQAQDQLYRIEAEISRAKIEREMFESRLRALLEEHRLLLENRERDRSERENLRFLARRPGAEAG